MPSVIKLNVSCCLGRLKGIIMITGNSLLYKTVYKVYERGEQEVWRVERSAEGAT